MRYLTPLFVLLLSTGVRAQNTRVDTVRDARWGTTTYYYVTEMPADAEMSKAEMFQRGIKPGDKPVSPWDRIDSLIVVDEQTGERVRTLPSVPPEAETSQGPFFDQRVVRISGRIGEAFSHDTEIRNRDATDVQLRRRDSDVGLVTEPQNLNLPASGKAGFRTTGQLPRGSENRLVTFSDDGDHQLQVHFALIGFDLHEEDFVADAVAAAAAPWVVPDGRETLYLRLRSTEKLMTIHKDGKIYSRVAVGHQLDEINLSGLGRGRYLLEVTELGTGRKRYHGLKR